MVEQKNDRYITDKLATVIKLNFHHSHPVHDAQLLSLRPVALTTKQQLLGHFDEGLGTSVVIGIVRDRLEMDPDHTPQDLADAALHPTPRAIYYQHERWRERTRWSRFRVFWETLNQKLPTYMQDGHRISICKEPFAVAIITPILRRAHRQPSSICFVGSTASCDSEKHAITFFLTPTMCGCVQLGVLITSSTSEAVYTAGFQLMKDSFGDSAFGGQLFPSVFMSL